MHFTKLVQFIEQFLILKKKYPIVAHYHKFLMSLQTPEREKEQDSETNSFVVWLGTNPQISKKILDNPKYTSTAKGKVVYFDVILKLLDENAVKAFWKNINRLCKDVGSVEPSVNYVFNKIQHNKFVKELLHDLNLDQTLDSLDLDKMEINDLDSLLFSNKFIPTVTKLKDGIASGKYDYKNFMPLIKETFKDLQKVDGIDDDSKKTLSVLDKELGNFTKGKEPNLSNVMNALKSDPLVSQTSFNTILDKLA